MSKDNLPSDSYDEEDDNNSSSSDDESELLSSPSSPHNQIRKNAVVYNQQYKKNMKDLMKRKIKKKDLYNVGDIVNLKISNVDKTKLGRNQLPCKILEVKPKGFYKLGCSEGRLSINYQGKSLEPTKLTRMTELENISDKVVTVTEAVRLQNNKNLTKCKCPNTNCSTMKCPCKKVNSACNDKCHPSRKCKNPGISSL